jgi:DNA primase
LAASPVVTALFRERAVNQLHLERRKGGTGTRLRVEDLAGLLGLVEMAS